jgi:phenylacetate-CoA ligase
MLIVRGVNVFPGQVEELILRCEGLAPHFEIELSRPKRLDEMRIRVEARADTASDAFLGQAGRLAAMLKDNIGISAEISVVPCGSLPRSSGKAKHVRDRR